MAGEISKTKVAIVTGSSSGIGFETSLLLARNGFFTYATMRNLDKSNRINELKQKERLPLEVLKLNVTDDKSVNEEIDKIANEQETIDLLVNNARLCIGRTVRRAFHPRIQRTTWN